MRWISVEERLPEKKGIEVFVCDVVNGEVSMGRYLGLPECPWVWDRSALMRQVTHYMLIPELPSREGVYGAVSRFVE